MECESSCDIPTEIKFENKNDTSQINWIDLINSQIKQQKLVSKTILNIIIKILKMGLIYANTIKLIQIIMDHFSILI